MTPLAIATHQGHVALVEALLARPCIDVNAKVALVQEGEQVEGLFNMTALHLAAFESHSPLVKVFLADERVDVNATYHVQPLPLLVYLR